MSEQRIRDLIAKLEAATEGSHEFDGLIWDTLGPVKPRSIHRYTSSLDAALTLVPEGCDVDMQTRKRYAMVADWRGRDHGVPLGSSIGVATLPLALCIAALKARVDQ